MDRKIHRSWEKRLQRAKLEPQFRALHKGYIEQGMSHQDAYSQALDQIKPAIAHWESQNREVVNAKRYVNQQKAKEVEARKAEIAARIEQKQRVGEDILAEARELMELQHPLMKPNHTFARDQDPWGSLAMSVPAIEADYWKTIWFVANNIYTPIEAISPLECPCRAAVTMLKSIRENPTAYQSFLKDHFAKLAPTKGELDAQARNRSDNGKLMEYFSVFEASLKQKRKTVFNDSDTVDEFGEVTDDEEDFDEDGTEG